MTHQAFIHTRKTTTIALALALAIPLLGTADAGTHLTGTAKITGTDASTTARGVATETFPRGAPGVLGLENTYSYAEDDSQNERDRWTFILRAEFTSRSDLDRSTERVINDQYGPSEYGSGERLLTWHWSEFSNRDADGVYTIGAILEQGGWAWGGFTITDESYAAGAIQVDVVEANGMN